MKSIAYISSLFFAAIFSFFQTQKIITVDFTMPKEVTAGNSFILEANVSKGDIANFSKLQLKFPEGFTAELIDGKGGTFTFHDKNLKLIWINLPEEATFKVKFKVSVARSVTGLHNFNGKIDYILDTDRGKTTLSTPNIKVIPNTSATTTAGTGNEAGTTATTINTGTTKGEISCERKIPVTQVKAGESFKVELTINKSDIKGVGKIIEALPEGFTASEGQSNGAIFSFTGNEVKLLWMVMPAENQFTVSYNVATDQGVVGNKVIEGMFSYVENGESRKKIIASSSISVGASTVAGTNTNTTATTSAQTNATTASDVTTNTGSDEGTEANNTSTDNTGSEGTETSGTTVSTGGGTTTSTTTTSVQNSNHNVNYRVQICATKRPVNTNYFVKHHNINQKIYTNMHQGWHKFTVGNFDLYKKARDHREFIKANKKIIGPFVTAYNSGTRITVQEALMITKHNWMP